MNEVGQIVGNSGGGGYAPDHDRNRSLPNASLSRSNSSVAAKSPRLARAATYNRGPSSATTAGHSIPHVPLASAPSAVSPSAPVPQPTIQIPPISTSGFNMIEIPSMDTLASPILSPAVSAEAVPLSVGPSAGASQQRAGNRQPNQGENQLSEYALHILFTQFVRMAERKISDCMKFPMNDEPPIPNILGPGADPNFDQVISSLGYLAQRLPGYVIDSVMYWRRQKSEAAQSKTPSEQLYTDSLQEADRKSVLSIYVLCRVLMEIVKQAHIAVAANDLSEKLEEIVYTQLKSADPDLVSTSIIRGANWNLFSRLLGQMSETRFAQVADRFVADLEKEKSLPHVKTQLIVHGMKYLRLKVYPMEAMDESAELLESLAKFFSRTLNNQVRLAYADVLAEMLLPPAAKGNAEFNHPLWAASIKQLYASALEFMSKPKYWRAGFTLACTVLCVAPTDFFLKNWLVLFDKEQSKVKDKPTRGTFCSGVSRLIWVYTTRCSESLNATIKNIDFVCKGLFYSGTKKLWATASSDTLMKISLVNIIRTLGYSNIQYVLEHLLPGLLMGSLSTANATVIQDVLSITTDSIVPERTAICLRGLAFVLSDMERQEQPPLLPLETDDQASLASESVRLPEKPLNLSGTVGEYHTFYCRAVCKLAGLLNNQLGVDERGNSSVPSSGSFGPTRSNLQLAASLPSSFPFSNSGSTLDFGGLTKTSFSSLFALTLETLPWFVSSSTNSLPKILEILYCNLSHYDSKLSQIASSSITALLNVKDHKTVLASYTKLLLATDERLLTSDNMANVNLVNCVKIYADIVEHWTSAIVDRKMDTTPSMWTAVEEIEGNGLFFLCSPNREIRQLAISILSLCTKFDQSLGSNATDGRLISFLESADVSELLKRTQPNFTLSVPERSRITKLQGRKKENLVRMAESDYGVDTALWLKAFPELIRECADKYPIPMAHCRSLVCVRLVQMYDYILGIAENRTSSNMSVNSSVNHPMKTHADRVVEQWRNFLIVACATLTLTDEQKIHIPDTFQQHNRKKSAQKITIHHQKITSVRSVFRMVIPLLSLDHSVIRHAIQTGLSFININIYRALIECVQPAFNQWREELSQGIVTTPGGHAEASFNRRVRAITELAHALEQTSHYLKQKIVYEDVWFLKTTIAFADVLRHHLSDSRVQLSWAHQKLRTYFCGFVEHIYEGYKRLVAERPDFEHLLVFSVRMKYFSLMEEWCGMGAHWSRARERMHHMKKVEVSKSKDDPNLLQAAMEIQIRALEVAAGSAMAALCDGPLVQPHPEKGQTATAEFNVEGLLKWIDITITSGADDMMVIGKRALFNLLRSNPKIKQIVGETIANCYRDHSKSSDNLKSDVAKVYFSVIVDLMEQSPEYDLEVWQLVCLGLFKIGDPDQEVRVMASKLLKATEQRFWDSNVVSDYGANIISPSLAVYKRALFHLSSKYAQSHPGEALMVFSELTMFFHVVNDISRRDILAVLLPWMQTIELTDTTTSASSESSSGLSSASTMVLSNLFEITVVWGHKMQNEVEALWVALGNGRYTSNVNAVVQFLFRNSLDRRNVEFVEHSRKIIVYLGLTAAGANLSEQLLSNLEPRSMIPQQKKHQSQHNFDMGKIPYVADLSTMWSVNESPFSRGQLALIFLVDLLVTSEDQIEAALPIVLQASFVLLDHYEPIVATQAREMLIYLVRKDQQGLCEILRKKDGDSTWHYDDLRAENINSERASRKSPSSGSGASSAPKSDGLRTPLAMRQLVGSMLSYFQNEGEIGSSLRAQWAQVALQWATTCSVRHIACRSFQIFRCLLYTVDPQILGDMLTRLANTISDTASDIQGFSMQILMTINAIVAEIEPDQLLKTPQTFWAIVASLSTTNEKEFIEVLSGLDKYLSKIDLNAPEIVNMLISAFPANWEGNFEGLDSLILKGLSSATAWDMTLRVLDKLNKLNESEIVCNKNRSMYAFIVQLPRYLHAMTFDELPQDVIDSVDALKTIYDAENRIGFSRVLTSYSKKRFRSKKDFLSQSVQSIQANYFPNHDSEICILLMRMLSNRHGWVKQECLDILKVFFPLVSWQRAEFAEWGADLFSPLLLLLQTSYGQQALEILGENITICQSAKDRHVLRMSLDNRNSSGRHLDPLASNFKREYENTAVLYGIASESGWSIPLPTVVATRTRNNVHSVFYSCVASSSLRDPSEVASQQIIMSDDVQFQMEDYSSTIEPTDSLLGNEENDGSMSNMWSVLDSLDNFFAHAQDSSKNTFHSRNETYGHNRSHSVANTEHSINVDGGESIPQLYDKKVSAILTRSLARTPSTISFRSSLADSFGPSVSNIAARSGAPRSSYPFFRGPRHSLRQPLTEADDHMDSPSSDGENGGSENEELERHDQDGTSFRLESLLRAKKNKKAQQIEKKLEKDKDRARKKRAKEEKHVNHFQFP